LFGPLVLLEDRRLEAAAPRELPRAPQRRHGLDAVHAADRLDVFRDDVVGGLRRQRQGEERQPGQLQEGIPHGFSSTGYSL